MELPILVAVISVSGSLAGTITGGVIVSYGNWYLARRKEKLEFKTACRLISTELQSARRTVTFWCRVNLTHGFQQQILQRGVKLLADEQPVSQRAKRGNSRKCGLCLFALE